jgi:sugar lactone lactonase YvrE
MRVEVVLEANGSLTEGPVWSAAERALYWVDIAGMAVHRLADGEVRTWRVSSEVGCVVLREDGGAIVALRDGFHSLDLESGSLTLLANPPRDESRNRFNDGKCDPQGRLWAGTQDDLGEPSAALYRLDPDGSWALMRDGVICSNGLGWSPDGLTFYYTDSYTYRIDAYDFDPATGELANERVFARDEGGPVPDGLAVDEEGFVWNAKWDGWKVVRYAPDGTVDREVALPVQRPTSVAFGGQELDVLYTTSARWGIPAADLTAQPLAGAIFAIDAGVRGVPVSGFDG